MKTKVALLSMALAILGCNAVLAATGVVSTKSPALNVRSSYSASAKVIGSLPRNTKIETLGKVGNFYKIKYRGRTAYVASSLIRLTSSKTSVKTPVVTNIKIPVLMYHNLTTLAKSKDPLAITKNTFSSHMSYLKNNGYNAISMEQLTNYMRNKTNLPSKPVVITFDDGYVSNYTIAYPILKANKQKATVFMIAGYMDKNKRFLTSAQLKIMDANGVRIENHTNKHEKLGALSYTNQLATINKTKTVLEKVLGRKVTYIAYPYGSYNANTIKVAKALGYTIGLSTEAGLTSRADNVYAVNRIFINSSDSTTTLARKIK